MADAIVAAAQPDECGRDVLERLRLHSDEGKSEIFVRRLGSTTPPGTRPHSHCHGTPASSAAPVLQLRRDAFRASVVRSTCRGCGMPRAGSNMRAGLRALNVKDSGRVLPEPDAAIRHKCNAS